MDLNPRIKMKKLEENIGKSLSDLGLGKGFLSRIKKIINKGK